MSALLYGRSARSIGRDSTAGAAENKLLVAIIGLIPAEVIAAHGLILGFTTQIEKDGRVTITDAGLLQASLVALVLGALFLYWAGRGSAQWSPKDYVRALIPPFAVLAWLSLIGTSAITPWAVSFGWSSAALGVGGVFLGLILLAVSKMVVDPKS